MSDGRLAGQIMACRRMDAGNSRVIYDLSFGVDLTRPKDVGDTLAEVIWEQDLKGFWQLSGEEPKFVPKYDVHVKVPPHMGSELKDILVRTYDDLENKDLEAEFRKYLDKESTRAPWLNMFYYRVYGTAWALANEMKLQKDALNSLFLQMSKHITVSTSDS